MSAKSSDSELPEFIRSEMLDDVVFQDRSGQESSVTYTDFFTKLCQHETLAPHLELVSCITSIDEFHPAIYDCFVENYGPVDFETYPESRRKFSPFLFTLCLDFINNDGVVIQREYSKQGKNLAYLEKLLYTKIHYTKPDQDKRESVYYKDFLAEIVKEEKNTSSFNAVMLEAQEILLSNSQKVEVNENVMLMFTGIFEGVITAPHKMDKPVHQTYAEDLKFMLSSVGVYTCVNHVKKLGDIGSALPALYTVSKPEPPKKKKHIPVIVGLILLAIVIAGLVKMYY